MAETKTPEARTTFAKSPLAKAPADMTLKKVVASRAWVRRLDPFPHVVAEDVFVPEVADAISEQVRRILAAQRGVSHFGWYDAWNWGFTKRMAWPLSLFVQPEWHDLIQGVAGIPLNGYVSGGIHNHKVGSATGYVHNDFSPVWYHEPSSGPHDIRLPRSDVVGHMDGRIVKEGATRHETVRAVALLYYAGNDEWREGDGGETGLYLRHSDAVDRPGARVPPRNNSLVLFECRPGSYHTFITNNRIERNCVIQWFHCDRAEAEARWGGRSFAGPPAQD